MNLKQQAETLLAQFQEEIYSLGDMLFTIPELGFREQTTNQAITNYLATAGIPYESPISLTGIKASVGSGSYNIGLITDLDAIAVSDSGTMIPFHSCGHSSQNTIMLAVMRVLNEMNLGDQYDCKVTYLGTPAEEYIELDYRKQLIEQEKISFYSGKQDMIYNGHFDDLDCAFSTHAMGDLTKKFDYDSVLSGFVTKKVVFHGVAAHSGATPYLGKNALHGANLFIQAMAYLNEQFPYEAGIQIHPIITNGGIAMNVIPDTVVVESYVRANSKEYLFAAEKKFDAAAKACADAIGLTCDIETIIGYLPLHQSKELNELIYQNMSAICAEEEILTGTVSGASGDMGDVSTLLPTIQLGYAGYEGRIHSNQFEITDKYLTYIETAKIILWSIIDLLEHPELRVSNPTYAADKQAYLDNWLAIK